MYAEVHDPINGGILCIKRISDNAFIPLNKDNADYAEYLAWLAEGNEPLPADEEIK